MRGFFITFEGAEGSGKSTQIKLLYRYLRSCGKSVCLIREPGGTAISEQIRKILLNPRNKDMSKISETLLYMAARAQLVDAVIKPALKKGDIVLCDRFLDSTVAYQGYGCGIGIKAIKDIGVFATSSIRPDLTLIFDLSASQGLSRTGKTKDRIERRSLNYHRRVRRGYLKIASLEPRRIKVVKVDQGKREIQQIVKHHIHRLLSL